MVDIVIRAALYQAGQRLHKTINKTSNIGRPVTADTLYIIKLKNQVKHLY